MAQITYTNKVALNENQEVADINKVNASDMNEIKSVVNGLVSDTYSTDTEQSYSCNYINEKNDYSTNEIDTGKKWIDGKPIYRTVVNLGARTYSNGTNTINHNISNFDTITFPKFVVKMYDNWYERWEVINDVSINSSSILIKTNQALTVQDSFIVFEYTKTS